MEKTVKTRSSGEVVIYTSGKKVHFCSKSKYDPRMLNARDPVFDGSFEEAVAYVKGL